MLLVDMWTAGNNESVLCTSCKRQQRNGLTLHAKNKDVSRLKVLRPPLPAELPRYLRWILREPARALEPFLGLCIEAAVRCSKFFEGGEPVGALAHRDRPHFHLMKQFELTQLLLDAFLSPLAIPYRNVSEGYPGCEQPPRAAGHIHAVHMAPGELLTRHHSQPLEVERRHPLAEDVLLEKSPQSLSFQHAIHGLAETSYHIDIKLKAGLTQLAL